MITKLQARFVVPVDRQPIEDGAVSFSEGRIIAVGRAKDIVADEVEDFCDGVIFPGFVNAHTHLELSALAGLVPPTSDFTDWLARLVNASRELMGKEQIQDAVRSGIAQSLRSGVTCIGDITRFPSWTRPLLAESKMCGVSFGEIIAIGKTRNMLDDRLTAAADDTSHTEHFRIGISPHAPYSVEPDCMRVCAQRAKRSSLPVCIHLGEVKDEVEFTRDRTGSLAEHLQRVGVWDDEIPVTGLTSVELLNATGLLATKPLCAHANYVSNEDIESLAAAGASVAYCPRTHSAFGHRDHPLQRMLVRGLRVCVGTDSLASNPSLSILDELRFVRSAFPALTGAQIIAMGTLRGAEALGLSKLTGSISVGKRADLVVMPLDARGNWTSVFETTSVPTATFVQGERVQLD